MKAASMATGQRGTRPAAQVVTQYYEVRCRVAPYPQPTELIVEATDWDEVLHKYPDAELVAIRSERRYGSATKSTTKTPAVSEDSSRVVIRSHPSVPHCRRSLFGPHRCGICGRVRLSRTEYAWRRTNGLAVWRCQHRRPSRPPGRDLVEAVMVIVALTVVALWLCPALFSV